MAVTGVGLKATGKRHFYLTLDGVPEEVVFEPLEYASGGEGTQPGSRPRATLEGHVTTTMPGNIVDVLVAEGDHVEAGQAVLVVEAMKMENEIQATIAGTVASVHVAAGDRVNPGEALVEIEP